MSKHESNAAQAAVTTVLSIVAICIVYGSPLWQYIDPVAIMGTIINASSNSAWSGPLTESLARSRQ
ncbi:hypothetical protein [Arthrobacter antibioticus]|uniref:hypothetical protein n=1 Tax=Arthrobacter sp. H35-MC1 TaxID=3046203 RepID=UPI0024BB3AF2|nr:hypothetical protein [Arthrobacter sp. H35-MC1]MDJ0318351.1 hypothetical protein [Arthrobacter sp. H35-MC1]